MNATVAWPPRDVPLAAALFPERDTAGVSSLDRVAATLLGRDAGRGTKAQRAFLAQVAAEVETMAAWSDDAVRQAARMSAKPAFMVLDAAAVSTLNTLSQAAQRSLGLKPHRPQLLAAWRMIHGCLIELDTGEGKTLTAGLAATFAALAGVPVHGVTVNDYLAQRDAESIAPLFGWFSLDVGVVHSGVARRPRTAQYARAITYSIAARRLLTAGGVTPSCCAAPESTWRLRSAAAPQTDVSRRAGRHRLVVPSPTHRLPAGRRGCLQHSLAPWR